MHIESMNITQKYLDDLTYKIIGCAIEVHKNLGPGAIGECLWKMLYLWTSVKGAPISFATKSADCL